VAHQVGRSDRGEGCGDAYGARGDRGCDERYEQVSAGGQVRGEDAEDGEVGGEAQGGDGDGGGQCAGGGRFG
jgi:hypothetical protein